MEASHDMNESLVFACGFILGGHDWPPHSSFHLSPTPTKTAIVECNNQGGICALNVE